MRSTTLGKLAPAKLPASLALWFAIVFSIASLGATAGAQPFRGENRPRFDLQMNGAEWSRYIHQVQPAQIKMYQGPLDQPMALGKRNLEWLKYMNSHRPVPISLSSPGAAAGGIPIDKPSEYSEASIVAQYQKLVLALPSVMKKILVDGEAFTDEPGLPLDEYISWGVEVDHLYQLSARWIMYLPYRDYLIEAARYDVRGYYFLTRDADRDRKFDQFDQLTESERLKLKFQLGLLCKNGGNEPTACEKELDDAIAAHSLKAYYTKFLPEAEANWNQFFHLYGVYSPAKWSAAHADEMTVPYQQTSATIEAFLRTNIEDEWKWQAWRLKLEFRSAAPGLGQVHFEPGITPHVSGQDIYMDENAPLSEYDVQWTIRHEFGHVLGFPDCYLEFLDEKSGMIVGYQFDVSDLMCSRAGHFKERHFQELQTNYFH